MKAEGWWSHQARCVMCGRSVFVRENIGRYICNNCAESVPIEEGCIYELDGAVELANE